MTARPPSGGLFLSRANVRHANVFSFAELTPTFGVIALGLSNREAPLKPSLFALVLLAAAAATGAPAQAQNYPWCAHYDLGADEALNCGFVSFEQCMATVRGSGGF